MSYLPKNINEIKQELENRVGQKVLVTAQAGRKRGAKHHGILSKTYPAIFVVHVNEGQGAISRISYSYTDLLTENISIDFEDEAQA